LGVVGEGFELEGVHITRGGDRFSLILTVKLMVGTKKQARCLFYLTTEMGKKTTPPATFWLGGLHILL
jgi:hypothetical protein